MIKHFVHLSFRKSQPRDHPLTAIAFDTLPRITPNDGVALAVGALESAGDIALFELWAHPGERLEEDVGAGLLLRRKPVRVEGGWIGGWGCWECGGRGMWDGVGGIG